MAVNTSVALKMSWTVVAEMNMNQEMLLVFLMYLKHGLAAKLHVLPFQKTYVGKKHEILTTCFYTKGKAGCTSETNVTCK